MTDPYWDRYDPLLVNQAHLNNCPGCDLCRAVLSRIERARNHRPPEPPKEPSMPEFKDGHNTGTVDVDPWDQRIVIEWSDDNVLQTRVAFGADTAEAYANAILAAVEEARR